MYILIFIYVCIYCTSFCFSGLKFSIAAVFSGFRVFTLNTLKHFFFPKMVDFCICVSIHHCRLPFSFNILELSLKESTGSTGNRLFVLYLFLNK